MSEQKTTQAGRRGFLKLVTTGLPVAAVAAAAGTQALASSEVEILLIVIVLTKTTGLTNLYFRTC